MKIFELSISVNKEDKDTVCNVGLDKENFEEEELKQIEEIVTDLAKFITMAFIKKRVSFIEKKVIKDETGEA